MDETKVKVIFSLEGDNFEPDDITAALGILPDFKWRKGERIKDREVFRKLSSWNISTHYIETLDIEEQLDIIYNKLYPVRKQVRDFVLKNNLNATLAAVIHIKNEETPCIHFNKEILELLSYIGAEIDIDTYVFTL